MKNEKITIALAASLGIAGVTAIALARLMRKSRAEETEAAEPPVQETKMTEEPIITSQKVEPRSRVERMFGDRVTWNTQADEKKHTTYPEGYKGFLFLQCEACGKESRFFYKYPATTWVCECGHVIQLNDVRPAFAKCKKCEARQLRYWTNSKKSHIDIECKDCQAPIDLELNSRGTAYVTMGSNPKKED